MVFECTFEETSSQTCTSSSSGSREKGRPDDLSVEDKVGAGSCIGRPACRPVSDFSSPSKNMVAPSMAEIP